MDKVDNKIVDTTRKEKINDIENKIDSEKNKLNEFNNLQNEFIDLNKNMIKCSELILESLKGEFINKEIIDMVNSNVLCLRETLTNLDEKIEESNKKIYNLDSEKTELNQIIDEE